MPVRDWAKLSDLPTETLLQILSYFEIPAPHPFWSQGITPQTLLPLRMNHDRKSKASHIQMAKRLAHVCRQVRPVYTSVIWANFECKTPAGLRSLQNACAENNGVGSYIQELDLQLPALPIDMLETRLATIWPSLTSLHTITLTLTPAHGCPPWLAAQIMSMPTLSTLRLRIMGNSLGPHLRAPTTLKHLYIEVFPPEDRERQAQVLDEAPGTPDPDAPSGLVSREAYHNWAPLFNDLVDFVESAQSVTHMGWFVHWMLVHAFYRHITPDPADESNRRYIQVHKLPPNLTMLGVTLESQMGTEPFVRAMSRLPITDLAFTAYDHALLSGTAFKSFCESFKHLERLRLKLRSPSITVANEEVPEAAHNEDTFCEGLVSLKHLRCYKGPFLCKRPSTRSTFPARHLRLEVKSTLSEVTRRLSEKGAKPELLVQWSAWVDGLFGPKEYYVVPHEGPRRVDEQNAIVE